MAFDMKVVEPKNIELALNKLLEDHKDVAPMRASLFNLVVYIGDTKRKEYIENLIDTIISQFPCRVLLINHNKESNEDFLQTGVYPKLVGASSAKVLVEHISIEVSGLSIEKIPFLLLPNLICDLPVYLLWTEDLSNQPLLKKLSKITDRLIFDSECSDNLQMLAKDLYQDLEKKEVDVADLNWTRLEGFREVIKALFNTPSKLELLKSCESLEIHYNANCDSFFYHNHIQAHYLHTWLAAQLGWKFDSLSITEAKTTIQYQTPTPLNVETIPICSPNLPPGTPVSVVFKMANKKTITFNKTSLECIDIDVSSDEDLKDLFHTHVRHTQWERSLAKEICFKETSQHYTNMLNTLSQIQGLL